MLGDWGLRKATPEGTMLPGAHGPLRVRHAVRPPRW